MRQTKEERAAKRKLDEQKWADQDAKTAEFLSKPPLSTCLYVIWLGVVVFVTTKIFRGLNYDISNLESGLVDSISLPAIIDPIYRFGGKEVLLGLVVVLGGYPFIQSFRKMIENYKDSKREDGKKS